MGTLTHTHTQVHCCKWNQVWKKTNLKLYSVNRHKNRTVHKVMWHILYSVAKYIRSSKYGAFSKENSPYTSAIWQNIQLKDFCTTSEACIFLAFPIFYCILRSVCLCQECETRQSWLQTVLSHRTTHHSPASSTFEAPWTEHAQWHPVNKSLVEALMAVAHLVRLCTDPEWDQGPPAYPPVRGFILQIQRTNRNEKCLGR